MPVLIEPVVTLASLITHPNADEAGLNELIENGYAEDMEDVYVPMSMFDDGSSIEMVDAVSAITSIKQVPNAMWFGNCLYTEGSILAFTLTTRDGLWTFSEIIGKE